MPLRKQEIYDKAIEFWGAGLQLAKMEEELLELLLALRKGSGTFEQNVNDIKNEIVDVTIMLEQVRGIFFNKREEFYALKWKKLRRVAKMIRREEHIQSLPLNKIWKGSDPNSTNVGNKVQK